MVLKLISYRALGVGALASLMIPACASNRVTSSLNVARTCEWHLVVPVPSAAGIQILTRTTHALYSIGSDGVKTRGYILLARGQPNWYYGKLIGGGGHVNGTRPSDHVWRAGNLSYTVSYDPERNSATLLGTTIWLDTANVLMLDRVDQVGGEAQLLKTACVHEFDENDPARSYLNDSTIQAFIRSRP